mgnify:CR=1 FL=1
MRANGESNAAPRAEPFFRWRDWSAFWTALIVSLGVYCYTLAPTVTLEDSGELATASAYLGVPHPPGYPIWTIITWCFTKIFSFVRIYGQPNPAWSVGLASAVFGALASGFTAILICRSGTDMLRSMRRTTELIGQRSEDLICWVAGVSGSLVFAFTPVNWSQAVIAEVYSLNAFFLVLALFLTYVWMRQPTEPLPWVTGGMALLGGVSYLITGALVVRHLAVFRNDIGSVGIHYVLGVGLLLTLAFVLIRYVWLVRPKDRLLYLTGFVFGLGLTNYQVLLLLAVALALAILLTDLKLFRDFLIAGAPFVVGYLLFKKGLLPFEHPASAANYLYITLGLAYLAAVYAYVPNGKAVTPTILFFLLGLAVYLFMPLASETNPPMNWGYPRTWEGFVHAITRGQYERISPTKLFSRQFIHQVGEYLTDLRGTFTLPIAIVGFLPFTAWAVQTARGWFRGLYAALALAIGAVALILLEEIIAPALKEIPVLSGLYRLLIGGIILLAVVGGLIMAVNEALEFFRRLFPPRQPAAAEEPWVRMDVDPLCQKWTMVTFSAFLLMSVVLVALASPKGDIQDQFIQRVKFISSHALFAFWIGYGLVLGLACVDTIVRGNRLVTWGGVAAAALIPLIPILENGYNRELLRISGGAEQNGHDFGWQFGNYQLRGARAIAEELAADEEPLPNPAFPPEMGTNAVFFGGTDPGRFVPTYMIYSARVREDVYLITQNALADNTYMQVMRDLYGNRIWIPSQEDSARAFQRYVEEVKSGKRPPNAELKIEGGRVQVSGALGVMEINGILAQMIFEHNNWKHDFYVEESYVIQWMYPYLRPHGLIMKIDAAPNTLSEEAIHDDLDLWDWYVRRLVGNPRFQRDIVARKSFSKLRSAIAGLYARRGRPAEAEIAFQQARVLYPLSPEANFRLVQEVLMGQSRFREARQIMAEFGRQDPGNDRVPDFLNYLGRLEKLIERAHELETQRRQGKLDLNAAMELSECYLQLQRFGEFRAMMEGILAVTNLPPAMFYRAATMARDAKDTGMMLRALERCADDVPPNSPPELYLNLARMYIEGHRADRAGAMMQEYVKRAPTDWKAWLDLAYLFLVGGQTNGAVQALAQARQHGGAEAAAIIEQDQRFAPLLRSRLTLPPRPLMGLPGVVPEASRPPRPL